MDTQTNDKPTKKLRVFGVVISNIILYSIIVASLIFIVIWGYNAFNTGEIFDTAPWIWVCILYISVSIPSIMILISDRDITNLIFNSFVTPSLLMACSYFLGGLIQLSWVYGVVALLGAVIAVGIDYVFVSHMSMD